MGHTLNAIVVERDGGDLRLEPLQLPHFVAVLLLQRVELLPHVRVLPTFREVSFSAKYIQETQPPCGLIACSNIN